ncbi:hypothetical protein V6N11_046775 [Hibiscus sabdariffa]|uniref:Uncharacterized protein n=2 Tax=Hibiscus sabdariffa TaxID=183260 RepID=A0ABR2CDA8_9ROSI
MVVVDMVCESGGWDWSRIRSVLPREVVEQIATIPPPNCDARADKLVWRWERSITSDMEWSTRFVVLCWLIWKRRCCLVLASGERYREDIILRGDRLLEECKRVRCTTQKGRGLDVAQVFYSVPPIEAASLVEKDLPESELNVGEATGIG